MSTYVVPLSADESGWAAATEAERGETHRRHEAVATALAERGHQVTGGAEPTHSREGRVVRAGGDDPLQVGAMLADAEGGVEVRATVEQGEAS